MTPYRQQAKRDEYEDEDEQVKKKESRRSWFGVLSAVGFIFQGPLVCGLMYDLDEPKHIGVRAASSFVSLCVSVGVVWLLGEGCWFE